MSALFPASPRGVGGLAAPRAGVPRRTGEVVAVKTISPAMRRIVFGGPEMEGFTSLAPDDHVKLFFDTPEGESVARDYTPRRFDAVRGELTIDFVLHRHAGPASAWAEAARIGQRLSIGGPRGSRPVPPTDRWLLIGDETALPSIARRLEELPLGTSVTAIIEIADEAAELPLSTPAGLHLLWRHRRAAAPGCTRLLDQAIESLDAPLLAGEIWIATEIDTARRLRSHLVEERQIPRARVHAAGYWRLGEAGAHARIEG
ncbi:NADPH-dependent ferric siderophore reductase [Endobacter medicaginis]|uniref:NADPH-dependent ferric siderophore reductase n=3 Tax=Endobacter medicaginis TaxID=1181271 RepID=A0A839V1T0_9PROT|nr:NADPH-dependent ferric siderophore reductase [Endobacter medicaginis]MCX5475494.1 siderophore-interacting protein [Endobacter medicaginis]